MYWEADAATGAILWGTQVGPGGGLGGVEWGSATDGNRIYVAEADSDHVAYVPFGSTEPITDGSWAALDPATGAIEWQTPDPSGGVDIGAVSAANGVVYAGSLSGHMYALNAATGSVLWDYPGQGSSIAGPAIVNGVVYWGNGYSHLGPMIGTGSTTFYAFAPGAGGSDTPS
jgi:polyvinyl alcohol dehydrogenase (cytochrome)